MLLAGAPSLEPSLGQPPLLSAPVAAQLEPIYAQLRDQTRFWIQRVAVPLLALVGLFGNLITIIIMTRRRMRSTTNMYLAALALVDMLYLVLTVLLGLSHYPNFAKRQYYLYWHTRPFLMMLTDACSNTSVWLTVTFTIERFIAVKYPIKGKLWCTEARAKRLIVCVFVVAILFAAPVPFEWQVTEKQVAAAVQVGAGVSRQPPPVEAEMTGAAAVAAAPAPVPGGEELERSVELTTTSGRPPGEGEIALSLENTDFGSNETYKTIYYWSTAVIFYFVPLLLLTLFNGFLIHSVHSSRRKRNLMTTGQQQQQQQQQQHYQGHAKILITTSKPSQPQVHPCHRYAAAAAANAAAAARRRDKCKSPSISGAPGGLLRSPLAVGRRASAPSAPVGGPIIVRSPSQLSGACAQCAGQQRAAHTSQAQEACSHRSLMSDERRAPREASRDCERQAVASSTTSCHTGAQVDHERADARPGGSVPAAPVDSTTCDDSHLSEDACDHQPQCRLAGLARTKQETEGRPDTGGGGGAGAGGREQTGRRTQTNHRAAGDPMASIEEDQDGEQAGGGGPSGSRPVAIGRAHPQQEQQQQQQQQQRALDERDASPGLFASLDGDTGRQNGCKLNVTRAQCDPANPGVQIAKPPPLPPAAAATSSRLDDTGDNISRQAADGIQQSGLAGASGRAQSGANGRFVSGAHIHSRPHHQSLSLDSGGGGGGGGRGRGGRAYKGGTLQKCGRSISSGGGGGGGVARNNYKSHDNGNCAHSSELRACGGGGGGGQTATPPPPLAPPAPMPACSSQERRITIMLIAVVILFLFCQIPSAAMLLYTSVHETRPNTNEHALLLTFGNIFNFLMAVNAAGNFVLYSFLSKKYRNTFVRTFCRCFRQRRREAAAANSSNNNNNNNKQQLTSQGRTSGASPSTGQHLVSHQSTTTTTATTAAAATATATAATDELVREAKLGGLARLWRSLHSMNRAKSPCGLSTHRSPLQSTRALEGDSNLL